MAEPLLAQHFGRAILARRVAITVVAVFVVLPLSMLPRVSMLGFTSFLALVSVLYIMVCIAVESSAEPNAAAGFDIDHGRRSVADLTLDETTKAVLLGVTTIANSSMDSVANNTGQHTDGQRPAMDMVQGGTDVLLAIPLMSLALHCHCFAPLIYSEIEPGRRLLLESFPVVQLCAITSHIPSLDVSLIS
jgi:amino acid permease